MKKILCLLLACCISFTLLVVPASAENDIIINNTAKYYSDLYDSLLKYKSGEIDLSTFLSDAYSNYMDTGVDNIGQGFLNFADILNSLSPFSEEKWNDWYYENKMGGDGSGGYRDDSVLGGYGAVAVCTYASNSSYSDTYYCDYIEIRDSNVLVGKNVFGCFGNGKFVIYNSLYKGKVNDFSADYSSNGYIAAREYSNIVFYGDIRYKDGSSAEDITTELPEQPIPNYDDPDVPEDVLLDFLEDLLNDLISEFPDLSTVEGLLRSILAKLGTLDSDDDNSLLCDILVAIEALKTSDKPQETEDLTKCLEEIKDDLVYDDGEDALTLAEMLNSLLENQIKLSDITIDESLYNQRFELIQTKLLGKFSFIPDIKNFIDYALNAYSSSTSPNISFSIFGNSYNIDFSAFDDSIDLIRFCIAAFCYLSFAFVTFRKIPSYINGGDNT